MKFHDVLDLVYSLRFCLLKASYHKKSLQKFSTSNAFIKTILNALCSWDPFQNFPWKLLALDRTLFDGFREIPNTTQQIVPFDEL